MPKKQLLKIGNTTTCPAAAIIRDGKILIGHRHYTPNKWKVISVWTIPGGRCDDGEVVEATLRREVEEETGITDFEITDYIGKVDGAKKGDTVSLFLCSTKQDAKLMEPEKFSEWKWIDVDEFSKGQPETYISESTRQAITQFLSKDS